jgi:hypothetical protein
MPKFAFRPWPAVSQVGTLAAGLKVAILSPRLVSSCQIRRSLASPVVDV